MKDTAFFALARRQFHAALLQTTLTRSPAGVVSNADGSSVASKKIANGIAEQLQAKNVSHRIAGQTAGSQFEAVSAEFVRKTFQRLTHLRPGKWTISHITSRNRLQIAQYQQFLHLVALDEAARTNRELAAALDDQTLHPRSFHRPRRSLLRFNVRGQSGRKCALLPDGLNRTSGTMSQRALY